MKIPVLVVLAIFISGYSIAQECKVLKAEISTSYVGECQKGLANGKGVARGIDTYQGEFSKGLPEGTGIYTWANGAIYKGTWKKGMREGKGTYIAHTEDGDSTLTGVWRKDKYEGTGIAPYKIVQNEGNARYTITKGVTLENKLSFRFARAGKTIPSVYPKVSMSSGRQYMNGEILEIQDATFPVEIKLTFIIPNPTNSNNMGNSKNEFVFVINFAEKAPWEVTLNF